MEKNVTKSLTRRDFMKKSADRSSHRQRRHLPQLPRELGQRSRL